MDTDLYYGTYDVRDAMALAFFGVYFIIAMAIAVLVIVATWKLFVKAGKPGWASIVPFYSTYCLFQISFGNGWLFLLSFVPCVNVVIFFMLYFKLAKAFGQGGAFAIGLIFLNPIFMLILGFGDSEYIGPV